MGAQGFSEPEPSHHVTDGNRAGYGGLGGERRSHLPGQSVGKWRRRRVAGFRDGGVASTFCDESAAATSANKRSGALAGRFKVAATGSGTGRGVTGFKSQ